MNIYLERVQDLHSRVKDLTTNNPYLKISDQLFAVVLVNGLPQASMDLLFSNCLRASKRWQCLRSLSFWGSKLHQWLQTRPGSRTYMLQRWPSITNSKRGTSPRIYSVSIPMVNTPTLFASSRKRRPQLVPLTLTRWPRTKSSNDTITSWTHQEQETFRSRLLVRTLTPLLPRPLSMTPLKTNTSHIQPIACLSNQEIMTSTNFCLTLAPILISPVILTSYTMYTWSDPYTFKE